MWFQMGLGFSLGMIMHSACWKHTDNFTAGDLLTLAKLLDQAHTWISEKQAENIDS